MQSNGEKSGRAEVEQTILCVGSSLGGNLASTLWFTVI